MPHLCDLLLLLRLDIILLVMGFFKHAPALDQNLLSVCLGIVLMRASARISPRQFHLYQLFQLFRPVPVQLVLLPELFQLFHTLYSGTTGTGQEYPVPCQAGRELS